MIIKRTSLFTTVELILLIVLLLAMLMFPAFALSSIAVFFAVLLVIRGMFAFVDGLVNIGNISGAFWELIYGAFSLILGFFILWDPVIATENLIYIVAGWFFLTGFANILEGLAIRRTYAGELTLLFGGIFSVLLSIFLFIFPWTSMSAFVWFVAIYLALHIIFSWAQMERITIYELMNKNNI